MKRDRDGRLPWSLSFTFIDHFDIRIAQFILYEVHSFSFEEKKKKKDKLVQKNFLLRTRMDRDRHARVISIVIEN